MNFIKTSLLLGTILLFVLSCSSDSDSPSTSNPDETEGLNLVKTITHNAYEIQLFTVDDKLKVGYNPVFLRIKDASGDFVKEASVDWTLMMTMESEEMTHRHSTPHGKIEKMDEMETLYQGYIVFNMASDEPHHFWEIQLNFTDNGQTYELTDKLEVVSTEGDYNKIFTSVMGSDGENYLLALVAPSQPEMGSNTMVVALFKAKEDRFPIVDDYTIRIDPRMPGMGNHSATGNEDLVQVANGFYQGKVGFSMTGYWKLNLILENQSGDVLKGEPVTDDNEESSLHFKLEF